MNIGTAFAEFYSKHAEELGLKLASKGISTRSIHSAEVERAGLGLLGYTQGYSKKSVLVFGKSELALLNELSPQDRLLSLQRVVNGKTPFVILSRKLSPPREMVTVCDEKKIPLLVSSLSAQDILTKLTSLLADLLAPHISCHGSLVEIFGVGVMLQGESAIGKSEAALGLIGRGHRLISDDIVKIKRKECGELEGTGVDVSRHHMELRGIGIINIARLYGAVAVMEKKNLDIVVKLEVWNDSHFYDRCEHKEQNITLLGVEVPFYLLPVKPGRDVVQLLETIALSYRLKILSAKESKGMFTNSQGMQSLWDTKSN